MTTATKITYVRFPEGYWVPGKNCHEILQEENAAGTNFVAYTENGYVLGSRPESEAYAWGETVITVENIVVNLKNG